MSTIKLNGTTSGSSIIKAPDSGSTNQTFTLPDSTGSFIADNGSGQVGIGTTTHYDATTKLTVSGRINTTNGTATGSMNYGGGAVVNMGALTNHPVNLMVNNSTKWVIDTNGNLIAEGGGGIVLGNTSYAAANELDDYEEGTFTATIGNATTSGGNNTGVYIRVGRLCHFQYYTGAMSFSNVGGTATISGMPFTMESLHTAYSAFVYVHGDAITNCAGFHGEVNGTTLFAVQNDSTSYRPWVAGTKYCMVGGTYIIKEGS